MTSVGYSVEEVPMVMSTSCFDQTAATDAGASAEGILRVHRHSSPRIRPRWKVTRRSATLYQEKVIEYGLPEDLMTQLRPAGLHHDHEHGPARRRGGRRR